MPIQLSFSEEYRYPDDATGISIPVQLRYSNVQAAVVAIVDPGAAYCLFSNEDGRKLGLDVETGLPAVFSTLGGPLEAYGHEVILQTFGIAFESVVYFAKYPGLPRNLLGRQG